MTKPEMVAEILSIRQRAGLRTHSSYPGQLLRSRKVDLMATLGHYRANAERREPALCFHPREHCGATALSPCLARPRSG